MYASRPLSAKENKKRLELKKSIQEIEKQLMELPISRERSMAITKLDEALLWTGAAIAAVPLAEPPWDAEEDDGK